ncbi:hypothetical protein BDZ91DRAFT_636488, partial [Kalaharituber pfeilii]
ALKNIMGIYVTCMHPPCRRGSPACLTAQNSLVYVICWDLNTDYYNNTPTLIDKSKNIVSRLL